MRALVLSDIHANLEALNAVLAAAGEWDELWTMVVYPRSKKRSRPWL